MRTVSLEDRTEITTPIGPMSVELVSFYEDGSLNAVFPLNGQLSYAWTEADEKGLAEETSIELEFDTIRAKLISLRFYPTGQVRSLTLWPGDAITLNTPVGKAPARTGVRLHPDGQLASFEPAVPLLIDTPVGPIRAYDVDAITIDGDQNSVRFVEQGDLVHLTTAGEVVVEDAAGTVTRIGSTTRYALTTDVRVKLSIEFTFDGDTVTIDNGAQRQDFSISECRFTVIEEIETIALHACDMRCETGGGDFDTDGCSGSCSGGGCSGGSCSGGGCSGGCADCVDGQCTGRCG